MFFQKIKETAAKFLIIKPKTCGISRCAMPDYEKTAMVINRRRTRVCQSTEFTSWWRNSLSKNTSPYWRPASLSAIANGWVLAQFHKELGHL
jgi:hypothetical protein